MTINNKINNILALTSHGGGGTSITTRKIIQKGEIMA